MSSWPTLVDDYDVIDFLDMLAGRVVELLGVTACGLLLADHHDSLNMVAASRESARVLELFQLQRDEGPCLEWYRNGTAVRSPDLADADERWPQFAPAARDAGYAAVEAIPMRLRDTVVGALNVFSASPGALSPEAAALGQALADVATIGILHERTIRHYEAVTGQRRQQRRAELGDGTQAEGAVPVPGAGARGVAVGGYDGVVQQIYAASLDLHRRRRFRLSPECLPRDPQLAIVLQWPLTRAPEGLRRDLRRPP